MLRREVEEKTRELMHIKEQLAITHESSERMADTLEKTEMKVREIMKKNEEKAYEQQEDTFKTDKVSKRLKLLDEINCMIKDHRNASVRHDFRDTLSSVENMG